MSTETSCSSSRRPPRARGPRADWSAAAVAGRAVAARCFRDRGSDDRDRFTRRSSEGRSPASDWCRPTSSARAPTTARAIGSSPATARRFPPRRARCARGAPLTFPTETVAISTLLPNYDEYAGPPIELGRMEPTASDPDVQQQYGMTVGTPNSGTGQRARHAQPARRALGDVQGRSRQAPVGRRAAGGLAGGLRGVPQAARRARARRRARRAVRPERPTWRRCRCTASRSRSRIRSTRRTCGRPPRPTRATTSTSPRATTRWSRSCGRRAPSSTPRRSTPNTTAFPGDPGGKTNRTRSCVSDLGYQRSSWGGNVANPYDTTRAASLGSSSGSGASVSTNLVMCSICEETSMSCRGPANHNSVALILPHKAMISFLGGGDRRRHPQRSRRHPLPQRHRFGQGARRAEGSARTATTTRATSSRPSRAPSVLRTPLRGQRGDARQRRAR